MDEEKNLIEAKRWHSEKWIEERCSGGFNLFIDSMTTDKFDRYQVVGNIYENRELLVELKEKEQ